MTNEQQEKLAGLMENLNRAVLNLEPTYRRITKLHLHDAIREVSHRYHFLAKELKDMGVKVDV